MLDDIHIASVFSQVVAFYLLRHSIWSFHESRLLILI